MHTRLGLETIKVSGIDLKRRELARTPPPAEGENARGSVCAEQQERGGLQEGCYERCVQLTVASSVHAVPLATGVVNARGIPTYLRQFLFMADPPSPQGKRGRSFSLIGIELLFPFINNAGNPNWTSLKRPVIASTVLATRGFARLEKSAWRTARAVHLIGA